MSINNMPKEELELLSYKDITNLLLEEDGAQNTPTLFKKIIKLLDLPQSTFEAKIGDYYMMLVTDKRFILLDNGNWDLRNRHTSDKIVTVEEDEDEIDVEESTNQPKEEDNDSEEDFDSQNDDNDFDDGDDDLKDLVIIDEDELDLENN